MAPVPPPTSSKTPAPLCIYIMLFYNMYMYKYVSLSLSPCLSLSSRSVMQPILAQLEVSCLQLLVSTLTWLPLMILFLVCFHSSRHLDSSPCIRAMLILSNFLNEFCCGTKSSWMQLLCLQLEVSCLYLSFFVYSCVWELCCLQFECLSYNSSFVAYNEVSLLTMGKCV